jgi:hypothetical protein
VQQLGEVRSFLVDLCALDVVLHEDCDGVGVVEHVGAVLGRQGRVDPRADRADRRERPIEEHPLERGAAEDPDGVALSDSGRQQAVRDLVHRARRLGPPDLVPFAVTLDEVRRAVARSGATPQLGDRLGARRALYDRHRVLS